MRSVRTVRIVLLFLSCSTILLGCTTDTELDWHHEPGYRWANVEPGIWDRVGFEELDPSETGITFESHVTEDEFAENQHYMNGSGVATGDVDGDGRVDLYFAQLNGANRLYKNLGGFVFRDITEEAGVAHEGYYSTGTVLADIDGDADLDLLVGSMSKGVAVYLNDGDGHFTQRTEPNFEVGKGNMTLALADVDADGDLDLYVTNYKEKSVQDLYPKDELTWENTIREVETEEGTQHRPIPPFDEHYTVIEKEDAPDDRRETGEVDALYLNAGDGTFQKVDTPAQRFLSTDGDPQGLALDWGLNASFQDLNQDGRPDLYVNNDFWTPDRVWVNQGDGIFRAIDPLALRNQSFSSMTVDFSDFNRDGAVDFFVTEMLSPKHERRLRQFNPTDPFPANEIESRPQYNRNSLYANRSDETYAEISYFSGLEASEWSWGTRFLDVDLDGYEDLLVNTGFSYDFQDLDSQREMGRRMARTSGGDRYLTDYPRLPLENKAFRNEGDLTFSDQSSKWGFSTGRDISLGLATADFDRDGDLDVAASRMNDSATLHENQGTAPRIAVRLKGQPPNTRGIGAVVTLEGGKGGPAAQREEITAGGDYLSSSAPMAMFAADPDNPNQVLTVRWPGGAQSTVDSVQANRIYEIEEPGSPTHRDSSTTSRRAHKTVFKDVSETIDHRHHEAPYDDFRIQPLLPLKLSQQGPGVSWIDFDSDGDDDLFIASGREGELAVYENDGTGGLTPRSLGALTEPTTADQTTILGWPTEEGTRILVGNANYEPGDVEAPSALHYLWQDGSVTRQESIPGLLSTTGPLAAADYDGDGDLDLFVGGRFVPAQYPSDATSRLFENANGRFALDASNSRRLEDLGLVTGAVFTDYDQDGDSDLLLSREWNSLTLLRNDEGHFRDVTEAVGLDRYTGWWNGVTTGDFNNDGRPDIVATNWGTNSAYQLDSDRPLKMYYRDFNQNGRASILEAYYVPSLGAYAPRRKRNAFQSASIPSRSRIKSHARFARSSLREILGYDPERQLFSKSINTLEHVLFLNEGDQFSPHPLPEKAQFTGAFHAGVADYDNDGNEDLFLSQNFFEVRPEMPRLDGGRALWLNGNGDGTFEVVPGHVSGVKVYGEQRGAALSDFNSDGKIDVAVSQNNVKTKLYENQSPTSGLTIRLEGPPSNRNGIGSSLRLVYANGEKGPRRELHAGSGYWSQRSATHVMGYSKRPDHIEVTWFDGQSTTVDVVETRETYQIPYPE